MEERVQQFKTFVRKNPHLNKYVLNNKTTWQKLYETWDLYGDNHQVWDQYQEEKQSLTSDMGLAEIMKMIKNIDIKTVQSNLESVQKAISVVQNLVTSKDDNTPNNNPAYQPRPYFKYFED